mgnify:CR=1|jgi:hypothetical protein
MIDDNVLLVEYEPSSQELFSAYYILVIVPFMSFIILQACIIYRFIR